MMTRLIVFIGSLCSGATLYLAVESQWLSVLAVVGLVVMMRIIASSESRKTKIVTLSLFFTSWILPTYWFFERSADNNSSIGLVLVVIPLAIYIIPSTVALFARKHSVEAFIFAFLLSELILCNIQIGNVLLQIGNITSQFPKFIGWYQYTGIFGGSVLIFALAYIIHLGTTRKRKKIALISLSAISAAIFLFSISANNHYPTKKRVVSLILNSPIDSVLRENNKTKSDYILTTESVLALNKESFHLTRDIMSIRRSLTDSLQNAYLLLGVWFANNSNTVNNAMIAYSKSDSIRTRSKSIFIPFGEYIPWGLSKFEIIREMVPYDLGQEKNRTEIMALNRDVISPLICYESIFPEFMCDRTVEGAEIFFVSASNRLIDSDHIEKIIKNISTANAIITNKYIVRATDNGISYVITNKGEERLSTNNTVAFISESVYLNSETTFYAKHHKKIVLFQMVIALIGFIVAIFYYCCPVKKSKTFVTNCLTLYYSFLIKQGLGFLLF